MKQFFVSPEKLTFCTYTVFALRGRHVMRLCYFSSSINSILQTCMLSHPAGLDVGFLVGHFVYFPTSCVRTARALARLHRDRHHNLMSWLIYLFIILIYGPRQANLVLIAYASSEGSGEPAHPRSLARTSAARSYKQ